jgi:predicted kinase
MTNYETPTLFLTVGLPGTGKTTEAKQIELEYQALRLTKDEWMKALYGHDNPESASDVIEGRLIQMGLRALELGVNVVIDYGLWGRDERKALRQAAADAGAAVVTRVAGITRQRAVGLRTGRRPPGAASSTWSAASGVRSYRDRCYEMNVDFDALRNHHAGESSCVRTSSSQCASGPYVHVSSSGTASKISNARLRRAIPSGPADINAAALRCSAARSRSQ